MTYTLAFDTSAPHCAVAVLSGDTCLAARAEATARGQTERLFPLIEEVLAEAGVTLDQITRIGVGIGPGNFTGIRIAVSAARGLALSLGIPAIGVTTFEAIRHGAPHRTATVPAPRDMAYVLPEGESEPQMRPLAEVTDPALPPDPTTWAIAIGQVATGRDATNAPAPAPLYIRPADAAPPRDAPPEIVP